MPSVRFQSEEVRCANHGNPRDRFEPAVLRPDSVRVEEEREREVRGILRVSIAHELQGLLDVITVLTDAVLLDMRTKGPQDLVERLRRQAASREDFVLVDCDLFEHEVRNVELVAPEDEQPTRRGLPQERRD